MQFYKLEHLVQQIQTIVSKSPNFKHLVPSFFAPVDSLPLVIPYSFVSIAPVGSTIPTSSTIIITVSLPLSSAFQTHVISSKPPYTMTTRYTPLNLLAPLHDTPLNYGSKRLLQFDNTRLLTT